MLHKYNTTSKHGTFGSMNLPLKFQFQPFPELQTERLILRRILEADWENILAFRSDPEVMRYIPRPLSKDKRDVLDFLKKIDENIASNEQINWGISTKEAPERLLGMIGFFRPQKENARAEIGYMLGPEHQGKGYMIEAMAAAERYGFETMQLHSIEAVIDPANAPSERVLQRCGYVKEAHFRENYFYNGEWLDSVIYSKLRTLNPEL
jgi:ribosomal-protein-alanine N-acetyltransferase